MARLKDNFIAQQEFHLKEPVNEGSLEGWEERQEEYLKLLASRGDKWARAKLLELGADEDYIPGFDEGETPKKYQ